MRMHPLSWLGIGLILVGIALVVVPVLGRAIDLSAVPSWLVYVYRTDGFFFVTSPFLIALSVAAFLVYLLMR